MTPTPFRSTTTIASLVLVLLLAALEPSLTAASASSDPHLDRVQEIFAWVNAAEGGFVSHKQSVSRMVPGDTSTPLMVVATEDIREGELLVQTPWSHILEDEAENRKHEWFCGTVWELAKEMKRSDPTPYARYLLEEADGQLPSQYSRAGKWLLWKIVGEHPDEKARTHWFDRENASSARLMPDDLTGQIDIWWYGECRAPPDDVIAAKAASMVLQRADDALLIPAYDAYNHRNNDPHNGKIYTNALTKARTPKGHQTFALRDISKGEQIVISYNMCADCGNRKEWGFGTAEMFRDYGFVEWYPQRWYYPGWGDFNPKDQSEINQFDLFQNEDTKDLTVVWTHLTENDDKMERFQLFLQGELRRLQRLKKVEFTDLHSWNDQQWEESGISDYEWTNINQFLDANIVALTLALADLSRDTTQRTEPFTASQAELEQLLADASHYAPLDRPELDNLAYYKITCDNAAFYEFLGYIDTEEPFVTERNQVLGFSESYFFNDAPDEIDVCMDVNNIIAMCSAYRPYHYEYMTHVAARYVPKVQRVATIGNGDSMLLHEVLKYPSVELVVGLELDQTVPRQSFKHFKTDPHFHDPRVDWWFGDVEDSLRVLPESYWGSFDVILVDIAEHLLFEDVTPDTTVLEALGKLLKPDTGVLVKNEFLDLKYPDKNQAFDYFMELVYESPAVCEETLALASHGVDFFHAPLYDHGIAAMGNLLYTSSPTGAADRHEMMHDYRANDQKKCTGTETPTTNEPEEEQTEAYGVLEVVTLEHLASPLESFQTIADSIQTCIEGVGGFSVVENGVHYDKDQRMTLIVMEQGYVAARVQENTNAVEGDANTFYVGFDIHLWSQTHRMEELKAALLQAHESKDASSHKIVVGGMFGTPNWKEDSKHIGPSAASSLEQTCNADDAPTASTTTASTGTFDAESVFEIAIQGAYTLTKKDKVVAAVFCGSESDSCTSLEALKGMSNIRKVFPIYDCSGDDDKDTQQFIECERSIFVQLRSQLTYGKKLDMFVLDDGASKGLHQIANSLFDTHMNRELFLSPHNIAVTWSSTENASAEEPWRWEVLDRYRKQIHHDPVKLAKFVVSSTADPNKTYPLGIVSTKDPAMNPKLDLLETKLNGLLKEKAATVQLRSIHGGLYNYNTENDAPSYSQKDYDTSLAEERFQAQVPLARQFILQYEGTDAMKKSVAGGSGPDCNFMEKLVYNAALTQGLGKSDDNDKEILFRYPVGDGCVVLLIGESFNAISVWDGKFHLDVNLFGLSASDNLSADDFDFEIREFSPFVGVASDVQPRGIGKVVNFPEDLVSLDRASLAAGTRKAPPPRDGSENDSHSPYNPQ